MRNGSKLASPALVAALLAFSALFLPTMAAWAQQPGAPPAQQEIQNIDKVWELQAKGVAQDLSLNPEQTTKLVDTYKAARKAYQEAAMKQFGQAGGRRDMAAMRKLNDEQRAALETNLKAFLTPEQTTKALEPLGTFNRRWDRLVAALDALKLDDAAKAKALTRVAAYAAESDKAMRSAMESDNPQSGRENMMKMREKLDTDLSAILSPEQMTQFKQATAMRGGGGGREGRREGAPAPAPAAPAPAPAPAK